jgi:hypothetical protein
MGKGDACKKVLRGANREINFHYITAEKSVNPEYVPSNKD